MLPIQFQLDRATAATFTRFMMPSERIEVILVCPHGAALNHVSFPNADDWDWCKAHLQSSAPQSAA